MSDARRESRAVAEAKALARLQLEEWIEQTGALHPTGSWRYEIETMLEQAIELGVTAAWATLVESMDEVLQKTRDELE